MGERTTPLADRLIGAKIVDVQPHPTYRDTLVIEFEHRGTDDDSGEFLVDEALIRFEADDA